MLSYDDVAKKLLVYDHGVAFKNGTPIIQKREGKEVAFTEEEPLQAECQAFVRAMESREPPLTDGRSGLRVLRVLQTAQQSLANGGAPVALRA